MKRIETLKQLIAKDKNDIFLKYCLALEFQKINQHKEAIEIFDSLIDNHAEYLATYYQYGKLLFELKKTTQALDILKKGLIVAENQENSKIKNEINSLIMEIEFEELE